MDQPARKKRLTPRSRSGCLLCREHHRKCDEERPVCGLCQRKRRKCEYGLRIAWGGRPFQKSIFGQCISGQPGAVVQVQSEHSDMRKIEDHQAATSFVYGLSLPVETVAATVDPTRPSLPTSGSPSKIIFQKRPLGSIYSSTRYSFSSIPKVPSILPNLTPAHRSLFDYFPHAMDSFSCDEGVKMDFSATFMPMAVETSHVMTALLNLAAVHRLNSGLEQSEKEVILLHTMAIKQLRSRLIGLSYDTTEATMASIILLCYSEIVTGSDHPHSWRLHLEGAASLLGNDQPSWNINSQDSSRAFLSRCFVSLAALANVSGYPPSDNVSNRAIELVGDIGQPLLIDDFTAFSTDLITVLVEIGILLRGRDSDPDQSLVNFEGHILGLTQKIHDMMRRDYVRIGTRGSTELSASRRREYLIINESYHQAALVHVYQRLCGLHSSSDQVQESVRQILTLLADIKLVNGPCPGIVLLFPLFSAGCGAAGPEDREQVRTLLMNMAEKFGLGTVRHSLDVLEAIWSHRNTYGESQMNLSWERFIGHNVDLILY